MYNTENKLRKLYGKYYGEKSFFFIITERV